MDSIRNKMLKRHRKNRFYSGLCLQKQLLPTINGKHYPPLSDTKERAVSRKESASLPNNNLFKINKHETNLQLQGMGFLHRHATYHNVAVSTNRHIHPQAYTEKRTLHTLGGQQTFLCSGRAMRKLIQLGLHAAQCMECDERNACQHIGNTGILGTTGTSRR